MLNAYYVPDTMLGGEDAVMNKGAQFLSLGSDRLLKKQFRSDTLS